MSSWIRPKTSPRTRSVPNSSSRADTSSSSGRGTRRLFRHAATLARSTAGRGVWDALASGRGHESIAEIELIPYLADPPAGLEERFSFPAVLKPVAGGGTMSTTLVDRREALADAIAAARETASTWRTFLLESFNRGQEWNIDGFVADGELGLLAVEAYRDNCLRTIKSGALIGSILFDPVREAWVYEVARPYVSAVLEALGLRHGIFHMEAFWDGAGLTFGECAARIAGGFHSEVVAHKYGVDLPTVAVQLAYGLDPPTERDPVIDDAVGFTFLPTVPGT